ncbi:MAG: FRG domain-containing protein [Limisphaerales bacterium]
MEYTRVKHTGDLHTVRCARSFDELINPRILGAPKVTAPLFLFRGQTCDGPLLPAVAREPHSGTDRTVLEMSAAGELQRRLAFKNFSSETALNRLVVAQHYGMRTRLLDWTENILIALWFACAGPEKKGYLWRFQVPQNQIAEESVDPFSYVEDKPVLVVRPQWHDPRAAAQHSAFTLHRLKAKDTPWTPLERMPDFGKHLGKDEISSELCAETIERLGLLGVTEESIFPGIEGTCKYISRSFSL